MTVATIRTVVDVVWQDGSRQRGVPSASLYPGVKQYGHEFFPGQRIVVGAPAGTSSLSTNVDIYDKMKTS